MIVLAAMSSLEALVFGAVVVFVVWTVAAWLAAEYAYRRRFPFWPVFLCAVFLGFPLVLLAVVIGAGVRDAVRETTGFGDAEPS